VGENSIPIRSCLKKYQRVRAVGNSGSETGESENSEESAQTEHSSCRAVHYTLAQSLKILLPNTWKPFS